MRPPVRGRRRRARGSSSSDASTPGNGHALLGSMTTMALAFSAFCSEPRGWTGVIAAGIFVAALVLAIVVVITPPPR